jgi:polyphosphate kinase 2 (PPK2 family)
VLDDRIFGRIADKDLARSFDEINEFEAQQRDYGTLILKLYFDVSAQVQEARLRDRTSSPWTRTTDEDEILRVGDVAYARAFEDLRANSDTRWGPWRMIDGDDEPAAVLAALSAIADAWAEAIPSEPPRLVGDVA